MILNEAIVRLVHIHDMINTRRATIIEVSNLVYHAMKAENNGALAGHVDPGEEPTYMGMKIKVIPNSDYVTTINIKGE